MTALSVVSEMDHSIAPLAVLALASDVETASTINEAFNVSGKADSHVIVGDINSLLNELGDVPTPNTLVVDVGDESDLLGAVTRLAYVCDSHVQVIVIGSMNDLNVYKELRDTGVAEYLLHPVSVDEICRAIRALDAHQSPSNDLKNDQTLENTASVVGIVGVCGGAGASMIAANIAWISAAASSRDTVLIDMNVTFGTQAILFDFDPGGGLIDAMNSPERLDDLFVKRAAIKVNDHLRVVAAEADVAHGEISNVRALSKLISHLHDTSNAIIVDLPRALIHTDPSIADIVDRLVLVASPTLVAMRDAARLSNLLKAHRPDVEVSVVLNRTGCMPRHELDAKTFSDGIGEALFAKLPFDAKTAASAEAQASCVAQVSGKTKLGKSLFNLEKSIFPQGQSKVSTRRQLNIKSPEWLNSVFRKT